MMKGSNLETMEQLTLDLDSLLSIQPNTSHIISPQDEKKKKSKAAGRSNAPLPFCSFFNYKDQEYVYLGVLSSTENWVADRILAIQSSNFTKERNLSYPQVMEKCITISLSDPELQNKFFIPLKRMPGNCTGYWVDTDTAELVTGHIIAEKSSRSKPSYLSKRKINAARR